MSIFTNNELIGFTGGTWQGMLPGNRILGFGIDSRVIKPGQMFVAIRTQERDGHNYIEDAYRNGAIAALVDHYNPSCKIPQLVVSDVITAFHQIAKGHRTRYKGKVIGVTGSCGKTTTKDLLGHLLGDKRSHRTRINENNLLGVPLTLTGMDSERHAFSVIEAGANVIGEMERVSWMIEPDYALITSVAPVHVEAFGSLEGVAKEKANLIKYRRRGGCVLFPYDCRNYPLFSRLRQQDHCLVINQYSNKIVEEEHHILYAVEHISDEWVMLSIRSGRFEPASYTVPHMSDGMLQNMVMAIATATMNGISDDDIQDRLDTWKPTEFRGQVIDHGAQHYFADCYNANPAAVKDAFRFFRGRFKASLNCMYILGCMGELGPDAPKYHLETGATLRLRKDDQVFVMGPYAKDYIKGIHIANPHHSNIHEVRDRFEVVSLLDRFEGAIFLKGSKPYRLWELLPDQREQLKQSALAC